MTLWRSLSNPDLASLQKLAMDLGQELGPRSVVCLQGPLGSGKTTFLQFCLHAVGVVQGTVVSPTYSLHHHFQTIWRGAPLQVEHWDLYRLESSDDLESTGFWDQFAEPADTNQCSRWFFVEWSDRLVQFEGRDLEKVFPKTLALWRVVWSATEDQGFNLQISTDW